MGFITKGIYENKENQERVRRLLKDITDCLKGYRDYDSGDIPFISYLLYKASSLDNPSSVPLKRFISDNLFPDIASWCKERVSQNKWQNLTPLLSGYTKGDFALLTLSFNDDGFNRDSVGTPETIINLVNALLDIKENDSVADIGCGSGKYLVSAALEESKANYYGYEIDEDVALLAKLRSELIDGNINIEISDAFNLEKDGKKYDKVFSNYPFGLKFKDYTTIASKYFDKLSIKYPNVPRITSSDWIFNSLLCDLITDKGRAIGIMTNGSTLNSTDMMIRKYLIEEGLIECVISLPERMFSNTNIPTTLIVLSHNNGSVRMIDATSICKKGRRQNELTKDNIETIVNALHADSEYSRTISIEELRENEYVLSLTRYTKNSLYTNGVEFESIIKSITRGAPCTASQLDEMVSKNKTNMQYLMLSNIQDGMIDDSLPYLSKMDSKYEKYCLKDKDLIIAKNGYPFKVAVASVKEGQKILANGNLYIIELDREKANPYYIMAFFNSKEGDNLLKRISVGGLVPNIGVDKLKNVMIPLPPIDEQNRIAQKQLEAMDEIAKCKQNLKVAVDKIYHVFDENIL